MSRIERAYITPKVIIWARESANINVETAANKIPVKVEKLLEWEAGESYPTVKQAEKLAKIYRRPFAAFFLPKPPRDFQLLQDFRRKENDRKYSTALIFMIREIQEKQLWLSSFLEENGYKTIPIIGKYNINNKPSEVAQNILEYLEIGDYDENTILKYWIKKVESKGIYVSQSSNYNTSSLLEVEEVRGFAISDKYAPFIFINSKDYQGAQLFTLAHELAHIWIDASGVSDAYLYESRRWNQYDKIELFCNEVAAEALMPKYDVFADIHEIQINVENIKKIAQKYGVSPLAFWTRLLKLRVINESIYNEVKVKLAHSKRKIKDKKEKKDGSPNYYTLQARRNSRTFCHIVLEYYYGGQISGSEASGLLGIKINKFDKFLDHLN